MQNRLAYLSIFGAATLSTSVAHAQIAVTVNQEAKGAIPIAIAPFEGSSSVDVAKIISNDLARSGKFTTLPPNKAPQQLGNLSQLQVDAWKSTGVNYITVGQVNGNQATFQLGDLTGKQIEGRQISSNGSMNRVAHQIADIIYQTLTNEPGAFDTRITYVATNRRSYALLVADIDGSNPQTIFSSNEPILSPRWSPDGRRIAYGSLEGKKSRLVVQDINSGQRRVISDAAGINSAPSFSPDGSRLAFSLSKDGNPEIYTANIDGSGLQRLTNSPAIDTEPTWSRDGSIYFTSDRGGSPQIYRMSAGGGEPSRITNDGGNNSRPEASPDGKKLAYVKNGSGIIVLDFSTGSRTNLSTGGRDESPSFSPNSQMIIYSNGNNGLVSVSVDGKARQTFSGSGDIRDPAWSPKFK